MKKSIIFLLILFVPSVVFSASSIAGWFSFGMLMPGTLGWVIFGAGYIAGLLVSIFATLAIVAFFYGIALFVFNSSDEEKRKEAKKWMLWSVVALFVLITIWGIIGFLQRTVGNTRGPGKIDIVIPRL